MPSIRSTKVLGISLAIACAAACASGEKPSQNAADLGQPATQPPSPVATEIAPAKASPPAPPAELQRIATTAMDIPRISARPSIAPALCAQVAPRETFAMSQADPTSLHSKKIFYVRTRNAALYEDIASGKAAPPASDFVVVKEAFHATESGRPGDKAGLFVAWREAGAWRFGTVNPSGVASVDGEATCAGCHAAKTKAGLFGPS